ncbi:MAG: hypothetical protein V4616_04955 [Bacteroidota bacterium]
MDNTKHLEALGDIRQMMERSSRFISLSGVSGICAGCFALIGAAAFFVHFQLRFDQPQYYQYARLADGSSNPEFYRFFFTDAALVLLGSLLAGVWFTRRKAKRNGLALWDSTARRLLINLLIPLVSGGIFCLILLKHDLVALVAPATLLFYGLALLNASKYTLNDIRYLGVSEIILGLTGCWFMGYGLLFRTLGFGVLHIVYGLSMYLKYER